MGSCMSFLRDLVRPTLHGHVMRGSTHALNNYDYSFSPKWSPFDALDIDSIPHWGALVWPSRNIGDETQAIAEVGLYPRNKEIIAINREAMKDYDGPPVAGLYNGWFLHKPESWPPSPLLRGSYVAFHANPTWRIDSSARDFLKANEPIGCRDMDTLKRLSDLGIEGYFSGCLTLTLENPFPREQRTDQVLVVDFETDWHRRDHPRLTALYERLIPEEIRKGAVSFDQIRRPMGRYVGKRRFEQSLDMLTRLATCKLVVTRRLHTALPCLAFGTPFIFIHDHFHDDTRFRGFHDVLDGKGHDDDLTGYDWDNPQATDATAIKRTVKDAVHRAARHMVHRWNSGVTA